MRERPNRHDWKSCVLQGTVGSNPTSSAIFYFPNDADANPRPLPDLYQAPIPPRQRNSSKPDGCGALCAHKRVADGSRTSPNSAGVVGRDAEHKQNARTKAFLLRNQTDADKPEPYWIEAQKKSIFPRHGWEPGLPQNCMPADTRGLTDSDRDRDR